MAEPLVVPVYASGVSAQVARCRAKALGAGRHEQALRYLGQDYEALAAEARARGALFRDPTFPPGPTALGFRELGPGSAKTRGVEWRRPTVSGGHRSGDLGEVWVVLGAVWCISGGVLVGFGACLGEFW